MLAVFPALIALVSIYGLVSDPEEVERQTEALSETMPPEAMSIIEEQLSSIVENSPRALGWAAVIAILGALWSAAGGTSQLIRAVNVAYDVGDERGFLRLRGLSILFTLGFILLGVIALGLIAVMPPLLDALGLATGWEWVISIGRFVLLAVFLAVVLALVYRYAPALPERRWHWLSRGAVVATVIWLVASVLFSFFVDNFGTFGETYGSLAGVIVLLFWFYISAFIILLGAEVNAETEKHTDFEAAAEPA